MQHEIKKYPVQHPLLRKYIRFFWELQIDHAQLNHKIIPQRNINLRFNLSGTPQYTCINGKEELVENVFFSGLQDRFCNVCLKMNGHVDMIGVCFYPDGFYPFLNIPVNEFKNQLVGASEVGMKQAATISEKLKEASTTSQRIANLENELLQLLDYYDSTPENFRQLFNILSQAENPLYLNEFCQQHHIGIRQLERMYNKYIGISASTYCTLSRFHKSMNSLLNHETLKLSDLAYDNGYFDQMHFIKDFKRFAGDTPKNFVRQNDSILQIGKLK